MAEQDEGRSRIVEAAAALLRDGGSEAVTTRRVAAAAGVQPPAIYRHFGDKDGLLEAVAEHVYAAFVAAKSKSAPADDPVADLAQGWDAAVEFGLTNPYLYRVMWDDAGSTRLARTFDEGMRVLSRRLQRVAVAGRLRIDEQVAVAVIQASARGAVLTWLATPEPDRNPRLLHVMRESMITAVTTDAPASGEPGVAGAARTLRALLPEQDVLRPAEAALMTEWLDRVTTATEGAPKKS